MDIEAGMELYNKIEKQKEEMRILQEKIDFLKKTDYIYDPSVMSGSSLTSKIKKIIKKAIKKSVFWLVKPYWEQQNIYNQAVTDTLEKIVKKYDELAHEFELLMMHSELLDQSMKERIIYINSRNEKLKSNCSKVIQIVSSLNFGDAVGNDVMAIKRALEEEGYITAIFATSIHHKIPFDMALHMSALPVLTEKDVVIYHLASEDPLVEMIKKLPCKKIFRYHNITPPEFFKRFDKKAYARTLTGLKQVRELKDYIDYGMTVSEFNRMDLINLGYQCPIDVVPILIPFEDYKQEPDQEVVKKYQDGWTNIIFVGRVAPNKKIEDVILSYAEYKKRYNDKSRLLLVGNYNEGGYYETLTKLIRKNKIKDVEFTGHISFAAVLAYYKTANLFVCMSEHEGFCVPLVEAMYFGVPIIAFRSAAVPQTLGDAGWVVDRKEPDYVAEVMHQMIGLEDGQDIYIKSRKEQLEKFQYVEIKKKLLLCLDKYMGNRSQRREDVEKT